MEKKKRVKIKFDENNDKLIWVSARGESYAFRVDLESLVFKTELYWRKFDAFDNPYFEEIKDSPKYGIYNKTMTLEEIIHNLYKENQNLKKRATK